MPGSAHVSCAGDGVSTVANFLGREIGLTITRLKKFVALEQRDQHAERMRYPDRI